MHSKQEILASLSAILSDGIGIERHERCGSASRRWRRRRRVLSQVVCSCSK